MERSGDNGARELWRDGTRWIVREADTTHVPGARGDHCLIFESDGVIRRAWTYPDDWRSFSDDALAALADTVPKPSSSHHASSTVPADRDVPRTPTDVADRVSSHARSLLAEIAVLRQSHQELREECRDQLNRCREVRREMRDAIRQYAEQLRHEGVPPERALVLVKAAMNDGLADACSDEPVAEELVHQGVEWCIAAYYAA